MTEAPQNRGPFDITTLLEREVSKWNKEDFEPIVGGKKGEARGRLMTLSAGIVGLLAPALSINPQFASPSLLKWSAVCLIGSIAIGAVAEMTEPYRMLPVMKAISKANFAKFADLMLASGVKQLDDAPRIDARLAAQESMNATIYAVRLAFVIQLLFYAPFIVGLCLLIAALRF